VACYATYLLVRAVVVNPRGRELAARNARRLVALERRVGIHVEPEIQRLLLPRHRRVVGVLNVAYVTLNVVLTLGGHYRLFVARNPEYYSVRRATVIGMLAAQPVFLLFPAEPPRKQEHLVDTVEEVTGVDLESGIVVRLYNPIAAMPSIHMIFAICTSAGVLASSSSRLLRTVAWSYPPAVGFTVLVTANHYVLDIVAGTAIAIGAAKLAALLEPKPSRFQRLVAIAR
jgi:membrane-associated phospholipid phosphatase